MSTQNSTTTKEEQLNEPAECHKYCDQHIECIRIVVSVLTVLFGVLLVVLSTSGVIDAGYFVAGICLLAGTCFWSIVRWFNLRCIDFSRNQ